MRQAPTPDNVTKLQTPAQRMMDLFPSTTRDHATIDGLFVTSPGDPTIERREDGKIERRKRDGTDQIRYNNRKGPPTLKLWQDHLDGKRGLVVGLLCDDGTTCATVVDVDDYTVDADELAQQIERLKLPLFVNVSKSGGPHVWSFHEPLNNEQSQELGRGIARTLGLVEHKHEIFPKLKKHAGDGKPPNGINMPYLGGHELSAMRKTKPIAGPMDIKEFLSLVERGRLSPAQIEKLTAAGKKKPGAKTATTGERGEKYAAAMLRQYIREIESLGVGERNEPFRDKVYHLGTMICSGWIDRQRVEDVLMDAIRGWDSEAPKHLQRHLKAGMETEHKPLPDFGSLTEDGVASEFAQANADKLRYDWTVKKWFRFVTNSHWKQLDTPEAFHAARVLMRALYAELSPKEKAKAKNVSRVAFCAAVEKFAASDADNGIPVTSEAWDTNPLLLGTPGGTVDLATVTLREADPGDMVSKVTAVAPAETEDCPFWLEHIRRVTLGDGDYARFLQKVMGYVLIGDNRNELMFYLYGSGRNGKGKLVDAIAHVMGDYHFEAPPGMFTASNSKFVKPTNEMASSRGSRMLTSNENAGDTYLDEEMIKMFTGGSKVTARLLHANLVTFKNETTPIFTANNLPRLKKVDQAIAERVVMMPFYLQVIRDEADFDPNNERHQMQDPLLIEKFKAEAGGILRWQLNGLRMYWEDIAKHGNGLKQPAVVKKATQEFLLFEDSMGQFINEMYVKTGSDADRITCTNIFEDWKNFCEANNENPGQQKEFTKAMEMRGFEKRPLHGYNRFIKIKRKPEEAKEPEAKQSELLLDPQGRSSRKP